MLDSVLSLADLIDTLDGTQRLVALTVMALVTLANTGWTGFRVVRGLVRWTRRKEPGPLARELLQVLEDPSPIWSPAPIPAGQKSTEAKKSANKDRDGDDSNDRTGDLIVAGIKLQIDQGELLAIRNGTVDVLPLLSECDRETLEQRVSAAIDGIEKQEERRRSAQAVEAIRMTRTAHAARQEGALPFQGTTGELVSHQALQAAVERLESLLGASSLPSASQQAKSTSKK